MRNKTPRTAYVSAMFAYARMPAPELLAERNSLRNAEGLLLRHSTDWQGADKARGLATLQRVGHLLRLIESELEMTGAAA